MTMIKICGLFREEDIDYVNEAQPEYIGFILHFPKSHRNVTVQQAACLKHRLSPGIRTAGVFVDQPAGLVRTAAETIPLDVIQLHGHEDEGYIVSLQQETGLPVWKAFRIRKEGDLSEAMRSPADRILLDNGYGTGQVFDWTLVKDIGRPFILAGGLTPDNIPQAVHQLCPEMIDISSGVETDRKKDREKILAAVMAVRENT